MLSLGKDGALHIEPPEELEALRYNARKMTDLTVKANADRTLKNVGGRSLDPPVVEVFANGRQAVMRRIYPTRKDSVSVSLFANGAAAKVPTLEAWEMMPSNPW